MKIYRSDEDIDNADTAYQQEYARWCWRGVIRRGNYCFELVRDTSPNGGVIDEAFQEITSLTRRECKDKHDAEAWLRTYRGRAAMRAALEAL